MNVPLPYFEDEKIGRRLSISNGCNLACLLWGVTWTQTLTTPPPPELFGPWQWGRKRSGVDPPLTSSHACLHTAFIAFSVHCLSGWPCNVRWHSVLPCILPGWGERQSLLILGIITWSHLGIVLSWVVAFACVPCWLAPSGVCLLLWASLGHPPCECGLPRHGELGRGGVVGGQGGGGAEEDQ